MLAMVGAGLVALVAGGFVVKRMSGGDGDGSLLDPSSRQDPPLMLHGSLADRTPTNDNPYKSLGDEETPEPPILPPFHPSVMRIKEAGEDPNRLSHLNRLSDPLAAVF